MDREQQQIERYEELARSAKKEGDWQEYGRLTRILRSLRRGGTGKPSGKAND